MLLRLQVERKPATSVTIKFVSVLGVGETSVKFLSSDGGVYSVPKTDIEEVVEPVTMENLEAKLNIVMKGLLKGTMLQPVSSGSSNAGICYWNIVFRFESLALNR